MRVQIMLFFILCQFSVFSQMNITEAKAAYILAEENYGKANYPLALTFLKNAQRSLGGSNCKILYLQIQIEKEISKIQINYRDSLIKTISAFQVSPDIKDFNEDKILEVIKMKIELEQVVAGEKLIIKEKKLADSIRLVTDSINKVEKISTLFSFGRDVLGQPLELAQKKIPKYFIKTKVETSNIFTNLEIIISEAEPKFAFYVNSNKKIIGVRKITETKKRFVDSDYKSDFNSFETIFSNRYKDAFGFEPSSFNIKGRNGGKKWTKDGKTGIISWVKHYSLVSYTEFYEDLIDESIQ